MSFGPALNVRIIRETGLLLGCNHLQVPVPRFAAHVDVGIDTDTRAFFILMLDAAALTDLLRLNEELLDVIKYYDGLRSGSMSRISVSAGASANSKQQPATAGSVRSGEHKHHKQPSASAVLEPPPSSDIAAEPGNSRRRQSSSGGNLGGASDSKRPASVTMDLLDLSAFGMDTFAPSAAAPSASKATATQTLPSVMPPVASAPSTKKSPPAVSATADVDDPFLALALR